VALPGAVMVSSTAESGLRTRIDLVGSEEEREREDCGRKKGDEDVVGVVVVVGVWLRKAGWVKACVWVADRAMHKAPVNLNASNMFYE